MNNDYFASGATDDSSQATGRARLTRRAVAGAVAWTIPVVAVAAAAPLAAASGRPVCVNGLIDWSQLSVGSTIADGDVFTATGVTGVTAAVNVSGSASADPTVKTGDAGLPGNFIDIPLDGSGSYTKSLTVTFSEPVTDLSFTIGDVDAFPTRWFQESAWLSPEGFVTTAVGTTISGSGTAASPWTAEESVSVAPTSTDGNISVLFPGTIQQFTLTIADHAPNTTADVHSAVMSNLDFCIPTAP